MGNQALVASCDRHAAAIPSPGAPATVTAPHPHPTAAAMLNPKVAWVALSVNLERKHGEGGQAGRSRRGAVTNSYQVGLMPQYMGAARARARHGARAPAPTVAREPQQLHCTRLVGRWVARWRGVRGSQS